MLDLNDFGNIALDYFPTEVIEEKAEGRLKVEHILRQSRLGTDKVWDNSKILTGMRVQTFDGFKGVVTNYHETELGKMNGGVEVKIGRRVDYYYANQLTLLEN